MATNIAGAPVCYGELNACVVRAARLGADCHPSGGANSGIVTAGLATMTADPDIQQGQVFEPLNACGSIVFAVRQEDRIKRWNISGEFLFFDWEMMELLFGATLILGKAGGSFAGKVIGVGDRAFNAAPRNGVYLEIIRQVVSDTGGDCVQSGAAATPAAAGHIYGKCRLIPNSVTYENDVARVTFQGYAEANAWLTNGPWNDYPGAGYIPNAPHVEVTYSAAEYAAILATVGWGSWPDGVRF